MSEKTNCNTSCKWHGPNGCILTGDCRPELPVLEARLAPAPYQALQSQVGGSHYKGMAIQPFEYIHKNGLGFAEGCVVKYVSRWRVKNGLEDLKKARHFLDLLIEAEIATASRPQE